MHRANMRRKYAAKIVYAPWIYLWLSTRKKKETENSKGKRERILFFFFEITKFCVTQRAAFWSSAVLGSAASSWSPEPSLSLYNFRVQMEFAFIPLAAQTGYSL